MLEVEQRLGRTLEDDFKEYYGEKDGGRFDFRRDWDPKEVIGDSRGQQL